MLETASSLKGPIVNRQYGIVPRSSNTYSTRRDLSAKFGGEIALTRMARNYSGRGPKKVSVARSLNTSKWKDDEPNVNVVVKTGKMGKETQPDGSRLL